MLFYKVLGIEVTENWTITKNRANRIIRIIVRDMRQIGIAVRVR